MSQIGSFALLLALGLSSYSFLAGLVALFGRDAGSMRLGETARRAGIAAFGAVLLAATVLVTAAFRDDFSIAYIFHHSNRDLPGAYKFAVLWSGQEGSLLFWSLLLAGYGFVLRLRYKTDQRLFAHASVVIAAVQVFFLLILNFAAHPFGIIEGTLPQDGTGLNPLLQYPEMVIHPPMLYLGYVGFTVPFAFALGALIMKYPGEKWIQITRRWTMVTWCFLTIGVFLGAHWAYAVLGWGGYWGWDPVENASLMPWLTGTAFLHSVMMQEKRGMLKVWNMWLIFGTFLLSLLGTFLTRSGVISSVHAFAQSSIGDWFIVFMALTLATCMFFFVKNKSHLKSEHKLESLVSRESSFLFNNLLLLVACFTVLWGTFFPILSEWVQGHKVTVGAPFFNRVAVPVALLLLLLTAVGPLLAWRKTSVDSLKRNFLLPAIGSVAVGVAMIIFGVRPWEDPSFFYATMAAVLSMLVIFTVISEFIRGGRVIAGKSDMNLFSAMATLWHRNTRRYGGYVVHFGVALVVIGILGTPFNKEVEKEMGFNDKILIGPYTLVCQSYTQDDNPNYGNEWAIINVFRGGKQITTMYPERRFYKSSGQPQTLPRIYPSFKEDFLLVTDLYLVYEGINETTGRPIIKAHVNPMVPWIWTGLIVMVFGTILALVPNASTVRVAAPVPVRSPATVGAGD
ncbi:MAG: heme lyase CcmF/NrfE family subunit [Acidobacteria bacterium]|nr:heme lyase CcmF/NrfE family subunit [Acidobacteriota bacterium]